MYQKYITTLLLLFSVFSYSQIITFPDENFKNALINHDPVIDTNGNGEIEISEAKAAIRILVFNANISQLTGIEYFINLEDLYFAGNNVTDVDLSSFPLLEKLSCANNNIENLDVSNNPNLRWFFCGHNELSQLNLDNNPNLTRLTIGNNYNIDEIDLQNNNQLELFRANHTNLSSLEISNLNELVTLNIDDTFITDIDISQNQNLEAFSAEQTPLNEIDFNNNTLLKTVYLSNTNISFLDISTNINLRYININSTQISNLSTEHLTDLQIFIFSNTPFSTMNLSNNSQLCFVNGGYSDNLEYVNLKNENNELLTGDDSCYVYGVHTSYSFQPDALFWNSNILKYICVDDIVFAEQNFEWIPETTMFIDDCSLSVSDNQNLNSLIYPNPVNNILNIEAQEYISSIKISNILGQILIEKKSISNKEQIDVSSLKKGIYIVTIVIGKTRSSYKIIKN